MRYTVYNIRYTVYNILLKTFSNLYPRSTLKSYEIILKTPQFDHILVAIEDYTHNYTNDHVCV